MRLLCCGDVKAGMNMIDAFSERCSTESFEPNSPKHREQNLNEHTKQIERAAPQGQTATTNGLAQATDRYTETGCKSFRQPQRGLRGKRKVFGLCRACSRQDYKHFVILSKMNFHVPSKTGGKDKVIKSPRGVGTTAPGERTHTLVSELPAGGRRP